MDTKQEVYHSSALGEIPLTFTGRHLMMNLREAIIDYVKRGAVDWKPLSEARGKIAQYMSQLERRNGLAEQLDESNVTVTHLNKLCDARAEQILKLERQLSTSQKEADYLRTRLNKALEQRDRAMDGKPAENVDTARSYETCKARFDNLIPHNTNAVTYVLPAIPPGYRLHMLNGIISIDPLPTTSGSGAQDTTQR